MAPQEEPHLQAYLYILKKRRRAIFVFFVTVILLGFLYTMSEAVLYRAPVKVLIEPDNPNVVDFKEVMAIDTSSSDYYQTQYQMLASHGLVDQLIEEENLKEDAYLQKLRKSGLRGFLSKLSFLPSMFDKFVVDPLLSDVFIRNMLQINPVRNSRLVEVSVLHPDAKRSAAIANALAELYIERNLRDRYAISTQATELISTQLVELKEKVSKAESQLQDYKERHALVRIPSIREKNQFLQDAKLELVKIQAEEAKLAQRYLPKHPKRIHIRSQIEGLAQKIEEEEQKIMSTSRAAIEYSELEREAESSRKIYEALLSRLEETQSQAQTQASNILIVDKAREPLRPYSPRPFLNFFISLILGLSGGIVLAFFLEYFDSTIKIPEDIQKALGLDFLGIIPKGNRVKKGPAQGYLYVLPEEHQPIAESFRALRTSLLFRLRHVQGNRIILLSSANPNEGKSTVALNLAAAFQQNNLRVLLMDADLRKPSLHKYFNAPVAGGVTEILDGKLSLQDAIRQQPPEIGFDFLSSGEVSPRPAEVLGSATMKSFLKEMQQHYDIIILDSSPYLAVADVVILSEFVDSLVIVARYQQTEKRHLKDLRQRFKLSNHTHLGVVINHVTVRQKDYYYHQYYYYGYGNVTRKR